LPAIAPVALTAHVVAAAFLKDRAVFATADGQVTFHEGASLTAHDGLLAAVFDDAANRLLSAGEDGRVVATAADGALEELANLKGKWIDKLAVGPQGSVGFATGRTAWVRLKDGSLKEFGHDKAVGGVAFLPKGMRLVTATVDKAILHWITAKGDAVELPWKGAHTDITVSPDGRFVVTCMQEPALHGWRVEDGQHMRMTGYPAKVKSTSWSPRGRYLATAGANAAILWPFMTKDGPMGKAPLQLGPNEKLATVVACHPGEDVVAIGYENGLVLAVRFADQAEVVLRRPDKAPISALAWDAKGFRLAYGCEDGAAGVVDIRG
jgi:WD40 repeat protein